MTDTIETTETETEWYVEVEGSPEGAAFTLWLDTDDDDDEEE